MVLEKLKEYKHGVSGSISFGLCYGVASDI